MEQEKNPASMVDAGNTKEGETTMAKLICGVNEIALEDIAGKTINEVKHSYGQTLNIPKENCSVLVNGDEVMDMDTVIGANDEVEFVKESGEKGVAA